jgi:Neuraminidase (sialidase)
VDNQGTIHTVWNERLVNYPTQQEIHYSRSMDGGLTWSSQTVEQIVSFRGVADLARPALPWHRLVSNLGWPLMIKPQSLKYYVNVL